MTYQEVLRQIEDDRDIPGRPERFEEFKELLDLYSREQSCVLPKQTFLIAGTNGKGSVAKTLETLLLRVHRGVGLFTSPHIVDTVERIRSYEKDLSHDEFIEVFKLIEPYRRKMGLSRFETFTLMMFEAFFGGRVRPRVECAVIEVGVGGRLDPTNAIPHSISVVTSIGRDHEAVLGNSLASIGQEKFGIVSRGNIVVCGRLPAEAAQAKMTASSIAGVRVFDARIFSSHIERSELDPVWVIESPWGQAPLALKGPRAIENTSIALEALDRSGVNVAPLLSALRKVRWPARMEAFSYQGRRVYLSGDHNPDGVVSLSELLHEFKYQRVHLVVGIGSNKPLDEMLELFRKIPRSEIILTSTPFRPAPEEALQAMVDRVAMVEPEPLKAFEKAVARAMSDDIVIVTGSLYLAGFIRQQLHR